MKRKGVLNKKVLYPRLRKDSAVYVTFKFTFNLYSMQFPFGKLEGGCTFL